MNAYLMKVVTIYDVGRRGLTVTPKPHITRQFWPLIGWRWRCDNGLHVGMGHSVDQSYQEWHRQVWRAR